LTDDETKRLADALLRPPSKNVYTTAAEMFFGYEFTDEDWDRLKNVGGVFKCQECNQWLPTDAEDKYVHDICEECVDEIDEINRRADGDDDTDILED
jgi:hypothetical protein